MSSLPLSPAPPAAPRRSRWRYAWRVGATFWALLVLVAAGLFLYTTTSQFAGIVRERVVAELETATGGRVDLEAVHCDLFHLAVAVDNLTIHGLEGPDEVPYAHIDRLYLRAKIITFFNPRVGLSYLNVEHPVFHLIVYPDGSTNQPTPKRPKLKRNEPANPALPDLTNSVFDLQANRVEVSHGLLLFNQRIVPFELAANDLGIVVTYEPAADRYLGELRAADIIVQKGRLPPVHSKLDLRVEAARNRVDLKALRFTSGASELDASGSVSDFAHPQWQFSAHAEVDLREAAALAATSGQVRGTAELRLQGQGDGTGGFGANGDLRVTDGGYENGSLRLEGLNATTHLRINPEEIDLPDFSTRLRGGGKVDAAIRYLHWRVAPLPSTPTSRSRSGLRTAAQTPAGSIRARLAGVPLQTALAMVAPRQYQNLGFATAADGTVNIDWTGAAADLIADVKLQLTPPLPTDSGQVPLDGLVDARYANRSGELEIYQFQAHTAATSLTVTGSLGLDPATAPSMLQVHLRNHNLGEFDHVLAALGVSSRPEEGGWALPVRLGGSAEFDGTVAGSLADPEVEGHLIATQFSTVLNEAGAGAASPASTTRSLQWDRLDATAAYSSRLISVQKAALTRGRTVIHASGQLHAHRISEDRSAFDDLSAIDATAAMHNASLGDLMAITGESIPATGAANLQLHAGGTLGNLNGGGNLAIQGGEIDGYPYRDLHAILNFSGHEINLAKMAVSLDGGAILANGSYNLNTKRFQANVDATNFELAHIRQLQTSGISVAGSLKFDAHASGALDSPSLLAGVHLDHLIVGDQPAGGLEIFAHTQAGVVSFTANSNFPAAELHLAGQTALRDDYQTQAKLTFSNLNIAPFLKAFHVRDLEGSSAIGGTVELSGPAKEPKRFSGDARIDQFSLSLQGITLKNQGPLRASLQDGVARLSDVHITGPATDLAFTGTAGLLGNRKLDISAKGAVNMALAEMFDADITSSGHVDFDVNATGTLTQPSLSGQARLSKVAIALNDVPNGISNLNGTLAFNQNRLEVHDMAGTTGGGQFKFAGFITYQQGIYADLTATGKGIRVRYLGLSATADTTLHVQGTETNLLLSGNLQITRFIVGSNVDFASFSGTPTATTLPDPTAPSSHVRLDIHITSSPQLDFQNSYAQLAGSVDLRIRGTVAQPAILGRISITEGTATFSGATYQLQRGEIYFTNPVLIEPVIDLDATTRIQEYEITVSLHGKASRLTPTFRSEPPLPQADVISLLALGRTQEEQQIYSEEAQQAGTNPTTNALLGGALNAAVGSRMQRLFGEGSVKIDPSYVGNLGSSNARITVQQNISQNVQLTYATNVNTTAEQLIQGQVNLTGNVSVVAVRDESGIFSLILKVHKRLR